MDRRSEQIERRAVATLNVSHLPAPKNGEARQETRHDHFIGNLSPLLDVKPANPVTDHLSAVSIALVTTYRAAITDIPT
jgi:hypothetical protein